MTDHHLKLFIVLGWIVKKICNLGDNMSTDDLPAQYEKIYAENDFEKLKSLRDLDKLPGYCMQGFNQTKGGF